MKGNVLLAGGDGLAQAHAVVDMGGEVGQHLDTLLQAVFSGGRGDVEFGLAREDHIHPHGVHFFKVLHPLGTIGAEDGLTVDVPRGRLEFHELAFGLDRGRAERYKGDDEGGAEHDRGSLF